MIVTCPYCQVDTAGNHEVNCPNKPNQSTTVVYSEIPGRIPYLGMSESTGNELKRLEKENAFLLQALKSICSFASEWNANHMGGVQFQRKRWMKLWNIAQDALDYYKKVI